MKLRTFFLTTLAAIVLPARCFTPKVSYRRGWRQLKQIAVTHPNEAVGKMVVIKGYELSPLLIVREFDDQIDTWRGQLLLNPRRNKFWAQTLRSPGLDVLLCFDWFINPPDERFTFYELKDA